MYMDAGNYLDHIKIFQIEEPNYSFLEKLQVSHMATIPFENIDIRQGRNIFLDEEHLFNKIVVHKRGGFCYELNGLFRWLLRRLNYNISIAAGRVYIVSEDRFTPEFDHMALLVHLDKTYIVDVGFGDCFRKPIAIPAGTVKDVSGKYRVKTLNSGQNSLIIQKQDKGKWCPVYSFTTQPRRMADFAEMCKYNQTSPNSHFTQRTICTIATDNGRITLSDDSLTIDHGGAKCKRSVTFQDRNEILRKYFGISDTQK
jgi:N-hydroxyarylamine O-acetyltransferase